MLKAPPWDIPPPPLLATKLVRNFNVSRLENLKNGGVLKNPSGGYFHHCEQHFHGVHKKKYTKILLRIQNYSDIIYQTHPLTIKSNTPLVQSSYRDHFVRSQYGLSGIRLKLFSTLGMKTKLHTLTSYSIRQSKNIYRSEQYSST